MNNRVRFLTIAAISSGLQKRPPSAPSQSQVQTGV